MLLTQEPKKVYLVTRVKSDESGVGFWGTIISAAVSTAANIYSTKLSAKLTKKQSQQTYEQEKALIDANVAAEKEKIAAQADADVKTSSAKTSGTVEVVKTVAPYVVPLLLAGGMIIYIISKKRKGK